MCVVDGIENGAWSSAGETRASYGTAGPARATSPPLATEAPAPRGEPDSRPPKLTLSTLPSQNYDRKLLRRASSAHPPVRSYASHSTSTLTLVASYWFKFSFRAIVFDKPTKDWIHNLKNIY